MPPAFHPFRTGILVALALTAVTTVAKPTEMVAVFCKTDNGYKRTHLPDNSYQPEYYSFAPGGRLNGFMVDDSIDKLSFYQVAGVVAQSLRQQNYLPTGDPNRANLLIFLSWGTTTGSKDIHFNDGIARLGSGDFDANMALIGVENLTRDHDDMWNARVLGYGAELRDSLFLMPYSTRARDIIEEVELSRYFVVLQAYDFQQLWKHKQKRLLWEVRFSIAQFGNRFDRELPAMSQYAAQYYGKNSGKLIQRRLPEGHVHVGIPVVVPDDAGK